MPLEGVCEPRDSGFREAGAPCNLLIAEIAITRAKAAQDRQPARQRRDEQAIPGLAHTMQREQLRVVGRLFVLVLAGHGRPLTR